MPRAFFASLAILALGFTPVLAAKNPIVVMETSMGTIKIELFADKAPITVENFLSYVKDKHYDGVLFHRVMSNFMIQGGGLQPGLKEKATKPPIKNESSNGLSNQRGTIAMARTGAPNSATSQFFINVVDNQGLDRSAANAGYAVFGRVIDGMDVVDAIRKVETTTRRGHNNVPTEPVLIRSARRK